MLDRLRSALAALLLAAVPAATASAQDASAEGETAEPQYVLFTTTLGEILLELDTENAPITVDNFLQYVDSGHYDNTIFHRVMANFMIQGGGFDADFNERPTRDPIQNEWQNGLRNIRGTIAMARTTGPDTASSQFFINVRDNAVLDKARPQTGGAGYAVFGKVVAGLDTVDLIRLQPIGVRGPHRHAPTTDIVIQQATRVPNQEVEDAKTLVRSTNQRVRERIAQAQIQQAIDLLGEKGVSPNEVEQLPSGLLIADAVVGEGTKPIDNTATVKVDYYGWFVDGREFDSSHKRGVPASFQLNKVVSGWTEGVGGMNVGGKRYLIVPPNLGYGSNGNPRAGIGPLDYLVFEVDLLAIPSNEVTITGEPQ
ncbi:MAG: peptidylprolyl isomerase [Planctomycetota bacterium]